MRFTNFDRSYQVLCHLGRTGKAEEFLCTDQIGEGNRTYLVVRVEDLVLAKRLTLFLEEKIKNREFTDYRECFQENGAFLAVFSYSRDPSLLEYLTGEYCGRRERAEIARALLERLLLLNPHPYFAWNSLTLERITVSRSLEVHLNYHLEHLEKLEECSMQEVGQRLQKVFWALFEEEEKKKLYPALEKYLLDLEAGTEKSYLKLYQDFMPVYEELLREDLKEPVPRTFWFRLWERTKKLLGICRKVLAMVILVAAALYVVNSLQQSDTFQRVSQPIHQIGGLRIEDTTQP